MYIANNELNDLIITIADLHKRASFPIEKGGLTLGCIDSILAAFSCSMAAQLVELSQKFPAWIQTRVVDNKYQITDINENISPYTTDQITCYVKQIQNKVPNGFLEGLNSTTAAIFQKLVKLSHQKITQLQPDEQSPNEPFEH